MSVLAEVASMLGLSTRVRKHETERFRDKPSDWGFCSWLELLTLAVLSDWLFTRSS